MWQSLLAHSLVFSLWNGIMWPKSVQRIIFTLVFESFSKFSHKTWPFKKKKKKRCQHCSPKYPPGSSSQWSPGLFAIPAGALFHKPPKSGFLFRSSIYDWSCCRAAQSRLSHAGNRTENRLSNENNLFRLFWLFQITGTGTDCDYLLYFFTIMRSCSWVFSLSASFYFH